jgi:IclR helix-turn-helix domain/Pyridoxamine 5'-phosphate oxidase
MLRAESMTSERQPYRAQVPAVARAVQALEHLAAASQPLSLSSLSRALSVGPSSLLAILTTLRSFGLVTRGARDGRYRPGPGLTALGAAAAQRLEPLHLFDALAADLVEQVGETVLLWVQQGDGLVLAATREGTQALRYVPPLGASPGDPPRLLAALQSTSTDTVVEGELQPGVWLLGMALPGPEPDRGALLAIVGPASRLRTDPVARRALMAAVESASGTAGLAAGPISARELDGFLQQAFVASLAYLSDDGYPATVPLWYDWDAGAFWLLPDPGAEWANHVRRNPRVSLAISESTPPLRRVLARGPLTAVDDPDSRLCQAVEARLAARYARLEAARHLTGRYFAGQPRTLLRLAPQRLIAWRGLLHAPASHDPARRRKAG